MQIIPLYRYHRADGGVTVSPVKPDTEYTELCRLIADDGKGLTQDGITTCDCIDTDSVASWYEIERVAEFEQAESV
jgi:hypothetical protein